jgi:UDP-N-acetylglucosamine:LPS N-acetylglucosamine transferase
MGRSRVGQRKLLAVSSGGGHWVELRRLCPAFNGLETVYMCTDPDPDADLGPVRYHQITNVTRKNRWAIFQVIWQIAGILRTERPDVVLTTGAAPGLIALALAKLLCGSRTVWIDSIAAAEEMSLSGRLARPVADAWLTQWPHLARAGGPEHWGAVL